jgi:hypothetical protein
LIVAKVPLWCLSASAAAAVLRCGKIGLRRLLLHLAGWGWLVAITWLIGQRSWPWAAGAAALVLFLAFWFGWLGASNPVEGAVIALLWAVLCALLVRGAERAIERARSERVSRPGPAQPGSP